MEQVNKAARFNENPNGKGEDVKIDNDDGSGADEKELSDMDKLPPEILIKILRYLSTNQVLQLRRVNSRWNEICCLLHVRRKPTFTVSVHRGDQDDVFECSTKITKPLDDFLKCFAPSDAEKSSGRRPCPFSRFYISGVKHMPEKQMCEFVFTMGPHIKTLSTYILVQDVQNFPKLWKLLLHFAPNIEHLIFNGNNLSLAEVTLFDEVSKFIGENDPRTNALNLKDTFLTKLKVLEMTSHGYVTFLELLLRAILEHASNIQEVIIHDPDFGRPIPPQYAQLNMNTTTLPWNVQAVLREANVKYKFMK